MKKIVSFTAAFGLLASMGTAAFADTAPVTSVTPATQQTIPASNAINWFTSTNNDFKLQIPSEWGASITAKEYTSSQLTSLSQEGNYLAEFLYTPQSTDANGNKTPVIVATVRGYSQADWNNKTDKSGLGKVVTTPNGTVYVLTTASNNPFTDTTDRLKFNSLTSAELIFVASTSDLVDEPIITPGNVITEPTTPVDLTKVTPFYDAPNGKRVGALAPQIIPTTGYEINDVNTGYWVEVYTWLGKHWINLAPTDSTTTSGQ